MAELLKIEQTQALPLPVFMAAKSIVIWSKSHLFVKLVIF